MFHSLLLHVRSDQSFDDCPLPVATPYPTGQVHDTKKLLDERGIVLDELAERMRVYFTTAQKAPKHIGVAEGHPVPATHIYVTSTNGQRSGLCTDQSNPCAIDYVFGKSGIGVQDFTAVHFDPHPSVEYPKMRLIIDKYVWLIGNGLNLCDSLQFEFCYYNCCILANNHVTVSVQGFSFTEYLVPCIHMQIDKMAIGEYGDFTVDIRCNNFTKCYCRVFECHLENKSNNCALRHTSYTQFIAVNFIYNNVCFCNRDGIICDTIGGFVVVDNRNDQVPVVSTIQQNNFIGNCFWTSNSAIEHMGGCCYAGLNLYAFACCNTLFKNNTCNLNTGDIYGAGIFLYNEPRCSICKYTVIAYSKFVSNRLLHLKSTNCLAAGAAVYLHGQGVALSLNNYFEDQLIQGVATAMGFDIACYDAFHFICTGCTFKQTLYNETTALQCDGFPHFIGGGSIYYDPYPIPPYDLNIHFAVTCCNFYGPDWMPLEVCPAEPDVCVLKTWVYGGGILILNDLCERCLKVNLTNDNFMRVTGDVGGAITILANTTKTPEELAGTEDIIRTFIKMCQVYFSECTASLYGGSMVVAPINTKDQHGCCGDKRKMFDIEMDRVISKNNWYPTSSFVISTAYLGICNFLAFENEAGNGVFYIIQTYTRIDNSFNISRTTLNYLNEEVQTVGGIFVAGEYSSFTFLSNARVFIKALGSQLTYRGWGLWLDPTTASIPIQNYAQLQDIIINRVWVGDNQDGLRLVQTRLNPSQVCSERGLDTCSATNDEITCISYCVCPYQGDPYCGTCIGAPSTSLPTALPPTMPPITFDPTSTPTPTPTPSPTPYVPTYAPSIPSEAPTGSINLAVKVMLDNTFSRPKEDGTLGSNESAHILVQTELTGGQLRFLSVVISNTKRLTGQAGEFRMEVPADQIEIIYWTNKPNTFGISVKVFTWPEAGAYKELYVHINAKYELPSGMGGSKGLTLDAEGVAALKKAETSNGAGHSLFGLSKMILSVALVLGAIFVGL